MRRFSANVLPRPLLCKNGIRMQLPMELEPTGEERITLEANLICLIPKATPIFKPWTGTKMADTYGKKAVLDFYGAPEFAELGILRMMERVGWSGVWVDTYRKKFRTKYWPKDEVNLPPEAERIFRDIQAQAGLLAGCFDVFCWKGNEFIFIESKRRGKDRIRDTQKQWIDAAIRKSHLPCESFLVVEWTMAETDGVDPA